MAYEYPSSAGTLRLVETRGGWVLEFEGRHGGHWSSADLAARAIAQHRSGLGAWDRRRIEAPEDLLDWRPLEDSL